MNRQPTVRLLLGLLLLVITTYIVMSIEVFEAERESSTNPEVRKNEYLAMQSLLERIDISVVIEEDYRRLFSSNTNSVTPTIDDSILLTDAEAAIPKTLAKRLLQWVEDGGFLVVSMNSFSQDTGSHRGNELLNELGVGIEWLELEEDEELDVVVPEGTANMEINDGEPDVELTYMTDPSSHPIEVSLETDYRIYVLDDSNVSYTAGNDDGSVFVQIDHGEGLITLMTETYIWDNYQIDDYDNAILMIGLLENSDKVYIVNPKELPHWTLLLRDYSPAFVVFFGLFICLCIWYLSKRFGGVIKTDEEEQTRFSDHIRVAGDYYWENDKQEQMITDVRGAIFLKINQKWPSTKNAEQKKVITLVSELSGMQTDAVELILYGQGKLNQAQFTQCMKGLQQLRKML
ncbi:DUF4350 domain-containing protein [Alteromonadaceae bacterium M269]|nr:DUF4350 domain-containing protein [Alteromonadaceae bacterium M269]